MRRLPLLLVALLAALPAAEARMVTTPRELDVPAGGAATFQVEIFNEGRGVLRFRVEPQADGLVVTLDRAGAALAPRTSIALAGTIQAPPWAMGDRVVRLALHEDGHDGPVETQEIRVRVEPALGLPAWGAALGTAGVAGLALGFLSWRRRWHLVGLALYTRLRRDRLAQHPTRAALLRLARERPGITLAEAQQAAGLANGPFEHHLRKLVQAGSVVVDADGRSRRLRLPGAPHAMADATARAVLAHVRGRGAVRAADAARSLGLSRQALHYHVRNLSRAGVLDARLERGRLVLSAPEAKKSF